MYVVGFRPADEKWLKMKVVWDACKLAKVPPPEEVIEFFGDEYPGDKPGQELQIKGAYKEWSGDEGTGYEIDIKKLPQDVNIVRVYWG